MTRYLNNAISANPLNYLAHNEFALVLRQQGQFQQALNHYELAIKSWPAFAEGYLNRGILYDLYMGRKSLALVDYELYQALSDDNSRQLKGWIIDLKRQIKSGQQVTQAGAIL
jgi:tetratricopeptide (TPR) repeat protein